MNRFDSDLKTVQNIVNSLSSDPALANKMTPSFKKKLEVAKNALNELQKDITNQPQKVGFRVFGILNELSQEVGKQKISAASAKRIQDMLDRTSELFQIQHPEKPVIPKVDVRMGFFCDLDSPDHNCVIARFASQALQSNIPCITTRSVLNNDNKTNTNDLVNLQNYLKDNEQKLNIYEDPNSDFVIIIPKSDVEEKTDKEILQAHDLNLSLKKCNVSEVINNSKFDAQIPDFINLFNSSPTKNKLFMLSGHGNQDSVGGLSADNYKLFLQFNKNQGSLGLTVQSCHSGGKSSLLHMPQPKNKNETPSNADAKYEEKEALPFPVIVRSIGDFITYGDNVEENLLLYLDELQNLVESPGKQTVRELKNRVQTAEEGRSGEKNITNRMQVYFPHSPDSPGGFRPVGEDDLSYSLSFGKLQQSKLESLQNNKLEKVTNTPSSEPLPIITVTGSDTDHGSLLLNPNETESPPVIIHITKPAIQLHPIIIDAHLKVDTPDVMFFSMIPGDAHHYIEEVTIPNMNFMNSMKTVYDDKVGTSKAFYIDQLHDEENNRTLEQFVCFFDRNEAEAIYYDPSSKSYCRFDSSQTPNTVTISPFTYALLFSTFTAKTNPDKLAVSSQTGGQQSNEDFLSKIQDQKFWNNRTNLVTSYSEIFDINQLQNLTLDTFQENYYPMIQSLPKEERQTLANHLFLANRDDLLDFLLIENAVTIYDKDISGKSLINVVQTTNSYFPPSILQNLWKHPNEIINLIKSPECTDDLKQNIYEACKSNFRNNNLENTQTINVMHSILEDDFKKLGALFLDLNNKIFSPLFRSNKQDYRNNKIADLKSSDLYHQWLAEFLEKHPNEIIDYLLKGIQIGDSTFTLVPSLRKEILKCTLVNIRNNNGDLDSNLKLISAILEKNAPQNSETFQILNEFKQEFPQFSQLLDLIILSDRIQKKPTELLKEIESGQYKKSQLVQILSIASANLMNQGADVTLNVDLIKTSMRAADNTTKALMFGKIIEYKCENSPSFTIIFADLGMKNGFADLVDLINKSPGLDRDEVNNFYFQSAILARDRDQFEFLIKELKPDINKPFHPYSSIFFETLKSGNSEFLKICLANNPDLNAKDLNGKNALQTARDMGDIYLLNLLLDAGANPETSEFSLKTFETNLANSIKTNSKEVMNDINSKNLNQVELFQIFAQSLHNLMDQGADVNTNLSLINESMRTANNKTKAFMFGKLFELKSDYSPSLNFVLVSLGTSSSNFDEILNIIKSAGLDKKEMVNYYMRSAILAKTKGNDPYGDQFESLISEIDPDINEPSPPHSSLFFEVIKTGDPELINICLRKNPNLNAKDLNGKTILDTTNELNDPNKSIYKLLIDAGALPANA